MICNSSVTIYHKILDDKTRLEKWEKQSFKNVWFFSKQKTTIKNGYSDSNEFDCRIPYDRNNINKLKIDIGDIIVEGITNLEINHQSELNNYKFYNITSITDNKTGLSQHLHLGGK